MIFNVQKCSIHDGVGLRTIVFFKGCPLRCKWCANPESQLYTPEIMEYPRKCVGDGNCVKVCPVGAISPTEEGLMIDREKCIKCFRCTEVCYALAKEVCGDEKTADELFKEVNKDRHFYRLKGGGATFSGGEPLTQPELLTDLAKKCKANRIDTTIETCGYGDYEKFKEAIPYLNYIFFDLKEMDPEKHKELTGVTNEVILGNLKKINEFGIPITIRTPVVPGCNDSIKNIEAIADFIKDLSSVREYELLPYHNLGESKYRALGKNYELEEVKPPEDDFIRERVKAANIILKPFGKECFYTKKNAREVVL